MPLTIQAHDLGVKLSQNTVLQTLNFVAKVGELTVILGANGAGKSTLLAALSGYQTPTFGHVDFLGKPLADYSGATLATCRAVVLQAPIYPEDWYVQDYITQGWPHEAGLLDEILQALSLTDLAGRTLKSLSGGEQQRASVARAVYQLRVQRPLSGMAASVLLLDEANSAMDVSVSYRVFALLQTWAKSHNWAVIAVVHDLNLAQRFADVCLLLKQGRLVACGQPCEVLNAAHLSATYDIEFCSVQLADGEVLWLPKLGV